MQNLGVMGVRGDEAYRRGMEVIVRSNRGLEVGQVLCEARDDALSHLDDPPTGQILREVSGDDANQVNHLDASRRQNIETCQKHVDKLGLEMKLVDIEQLFGGERMVVFYLAEERVDFRELVKLLASEFQTRIEMKQIGVRDEAKLLADYGDCGKPVCCNNHLSTMPPVSMRMAKLQKATLDPTKISGRCGRLKCCLRYEFDNYEQIYKTLPKPGSYVVTREGKGKVISQQLIVEQLLIETEDHRRILIDASEVLSVIKKPQGGSKPKRDSRGSKTKESSDETPDKKAYDPKRKSNVSSPKKQESQTKSDDAITNSSSEQAPSKKKRNRRRGGRKRNKRKDGPSNRKGGSGPSQGSE